MNRSSSPFPLCSWQHDHDDDEDGGDGDDCEDDGHGRDGVCHDIGGDTSHMQALYCTPGLWL